MRRLVTLACRAFPPEHRARRSDEVVDTALLASEGSVLRAARESLSLVGTGVRQRLRAESRHTPRDGLVPLAWLLATLNLAIALGGISLGIHPQPYPNDFLGFAGPVRTPYVLDWWWIAFAAAAAGVVLGLVLGSRVLALSAALANAGMLAYDALGVRSRMDVFTYFRPGPAFPGGWQWLVAGVVLALAIAVAQPRRLSLWRLPLALAAALLLVLLSREMSGTFFFLCWPLAVMVVLAMALGWFAPRLAVVAVGSTLVVVPIVVAYLTSPYYHAPLVSWLVVPALVISVGVPLAQVTRRRLA